MSWRRNRGHTQLTTQSREFRMDTGGAENKRVPNPPPISARFVQHQTPRIRTNNGPDGLPFTPTNDLMNYDDKSTQNISLLPTADVTDELHLAGTGDIATSRSSLIRRRAHDYARLETESQSLLAKTTHTYPPDDPTVIASTRPAGYEGHHSITDGRQRPRARVVGLHTPIPVVTVLARKAAPLYLPKLDAYLAALPAPSFTPVPSRGNPKDGDIGIFPPMDRLVASGRTLEDLETNSTISPFWRNRNTMLSGLVNLFLSVMVSPVSGFQSFPILYPL